MVIYCSSIIYKYCSCLECLPINHNEEEKYIHKEVFNNILHFIRNRLHINCIQYGFNVQGLSTHLKKKFITPISDYMLAIHFCQKQRTCNYFTSDDMISKFEVFNKMFEVYLTELM